jgi:hypothetical protein
MRAKIKGSKSKGWKVVKRPKGRSWQLPKSKLPVSISILLLLKPSSSQRGMGWGMVALVPKIWNFQFLRMSNVWNINSVTFFLIKY